MTAALEVHDLEKEFPGTRALDGASLAVQPGEVHALLGGNGSGKSTLIKAVAGVQVADGGKISAGGLVRPAHGWSAALASQAGIRVVHQQNAGFATLSVAENLAAGMKFERVGPVRTISWPAQRRRAEQVLAHFEMDLDPRADLRELRPAEQKMVFIARAMQDTEDGRPGLLILDEPTAALPGVEARILLRSLEALLKRNWGILYVTHLLDELQDFADRATVLRDGRVVAHLEADELDHRRIVEAMTGEAGLAQKADTERRAADRTALRVVGLSGGSVTNLDVEAREGEIVGLAGLIGSGKEQVLRLLFGLAPAQGGFVELDGRKLAAGVTSAMKAGVGYVSADRGVESAFSTLTVAENLSAADVPKLRRGAGLSLRTERRLADAAIDRYGVRCAGGSATFGSLSGGNQQKVVLARWLARSPRLLLLDEPTQGVDVAARAEIHSILKEATTSGTTILVASSDPDELVELCDRVLVLKAGTVVVELAGLHLNIGEIERSAYDLEVAV